MRCVVSNSTMLAAMVRTVWLYENRPDLGWSGGKSAVTNHQIVQTLEAHPKLREFLSVGEQVAAATGMIKSAAGAASYLVTQAKKRADLTPWFDGIVDGAGLARQDPRLMFRRVMFAMARKQAGQVQRRRDTREHVALYLKAFNAWATGTDQADGWPIPSGPRADSLWNRSRRMTSYRTTNRLSSAASNVFGGG
jgi:hypothetical protein